jgi:hypothetical protein
MTEATVRGERVTVLGPKPEDWTGLGRTIPEGVLVCYPDGEVGAVPESALSEVEDDSA